MGDGSAFDRCYSTSWSNDSQHQFFLMEAGAPDDAALHAMDAVKQDKQALKRAQMATNPSNLQVGDDEVLVGFSKRFSGVATVDLADLRCGQAVEVAGRVHLEDMPPWWHKALIARVHDETSAVDVLY